MPAVGELTEDHRERLDWFASRAGEITYYPEPLADGRFLVTRPKGIYKPEGWTQALSVRVNSASPYPDGDVQVRPDGSWFLSYHQENSDPSKRDTEYGNRALMVNIRSQMPVGILRERKDRPNNRPQYDVLGLAMPVAWRDGYFFFESLDPANRRPAHPSDTPLDIVERLAEGDIEQADAERGAPQDDYDARRRVLRQVVARRGQPAFRQKLLDAYGGRCAISDCAVTEVLEAAHLRPYRGAESNTVRNGLLLRADLHTLLDLQLLAVDPTTREVKVSSMLDGSEYAPLRGTVVRVAAEAGLRPDPEALGSVLLAYLEAEALRAGRAG